MQDLLTAGSRELTTAPPPPASASSSSTPTKRKDEDRVPKRGYRACVHCRLRKAKCDLGDVNAPSEPPCTRCRREQRNCVFLPSRRRKAGDEDLKPEVYPSNPASFQQVNAFASPGLGVSPAHPPPVQGRPQMPGQVNTSDLRRDSGGSWSDINRLDSRPGASPYVDPPTNTTTSSYGSVSTSSPNNPTGQRRRRNNNEPDATRRIVVASFNNETDALEILAKAATDADGDGEGSAGEKEDLQQERKRVAWAEDGAPRSLDDFVLIRRGILSERKLELLVQSFFQHHHPVLPIFQTVRIPQSKAQLAALAQDDPFLLSAIVCVASRHHPDPGMKEVHEKTYALVRDVLADYACAGFQPTIGFVEGVLILAENLPREHLSSTSADMAGPRTDAGPQGLKGLENRRSWALTGTAIRAAYGLGLDQLALEDGGTRDADLERARGVWTWCYLYDRTLGLRTGLAFWSRGPTLCFQGFSDITQTGEAAARVNFPYMMQQQGDTPPANAPSPARLDTNDSASMMQAFMELTQIMTNAHDILFSTPARTQSLVRKGEYFKFLDHFRRALDSFCVTWKDKVWRLDSARELTWCTYHFVRLYVAAFAFQAHVQRAQERAEHEREAGRSAVVNIFPRGSATSPDALFIYESIDAAQEILGICLRLGASGVLQYLPSRYLINFAYSGTFALKAAYSGAVAKNDIAKATELVERCCAALLLASPDKDHPACRYGHMLRLLSRRLSELSDQSQVPSRFPSPEAPEAPSSASLRVNDLSGMGSSSGSGNDAKLSSRLLGASPIGAGGGPTQHHHHHGGTQAGEQGNSNLFDLDQVPAGLFDVDMDVGFNLDGFWEDFTLTDSGGFPFR